MYVVSVSLQGVSGNNVYSVPNAELLCSIDYTVMELRREDLRFVEVLGEGQFGEVNTDQLIVTAFYQQIHTYYSREILYHQVK